VQTRHRRIRRFIAFAIAVVSVSCSMTPIVPAGADPKTQVIAAERAFAATMAARNLEAFASHVSEEAVFFSGPSPLRGRTQVREWWARYFAGPQAPFAWEPEEVEVLQSGALALSSGPVRDPSGKVVARFTSIWRLEAPGVWRVIFDKGSPVVQGAQ
jgi:ketosteroid isomerase-like protein